MGFLQFAVTCMGIYMYRYYPVQLFSIFSTGIVVYGEKYDFKINKYIQYAFYPVHLIILYAISHYLLPT